MRISNLTHWNARDVKRLVRAVAHREMDAEHHHKIEVRIKYQRGTRGVLGRCFIGNPRYPRPFMTLYLPRSPRTVDSVHLAHTIAHEFGHAVGKTHRDMNRTARYGYALGWRDFYAWAAEYPIGAKTAPRKPTMDQRVEKRAMAACAAVKKWKTRVKRAQTMLKKAVVRARYYEKRCAPIRQREELTAVSDGGSGRGGRE